jgi:hypothetical protein
VAGSILDHLLFGTLEDIRTAIEKERIHKAIERIQEEVARMQDRHDPDGLSPAILELLNHLNTPEFRDQVKTSPENTERLDKLIKNFIECVKEPLQAEPSPELEDAIKSQAISEGKLVRSYAVPDEKRIVIEISELEMGKWFFPLHFIRYCLQIPELQTDPLKALVDPPIHIGYPKSICVYAKVGEFTLTAYPKPIELDSVKFGFPRQLDELLIDGRHSRVEFEYWPNGRGHPKFVVATSLLNHFQLEFQEKGNTDSTILCLQMSYGENLASY